MAMTFSQKRIKRLEALEAKARRQQAIMDQIHSEWDEIFTSIQESETARAEFIEHCHRKGTSSYYTFGDVVA